MSSIHTLLDLLPIMQGLGSREAVRYNNGLRSYAWTYEQLIRSIAACTDSYHRHGLGPGDRVLIQGENRPEWIIAFWAAVARGLQVVPVDPGFSADFVHLIAQRTEPRLMICSQDVDGSGMELPCLYFSEIRSLEGSAGLNPVQARPEDVVEIVFTSGTTGEPKGIEHTHANICANLRSLSSEISSFRKYLRLLQPVRIVSILPLSHMFGQALGLFVPVLLESSIVLVQDQTPRRLASAIKKEKAAALVTVPGHLDGLQRYIQNHFDCEPRMRDDPGVIGLIRRWMRFRDVHRHFGLRFLALVVGGAQLRPATERWWTRMGFLVIQGYGLTEASPVVSMNNPLRRTPGSLGQVLHGQEVKIAEDGEILVKGENVARRFGAQSLVEEDGWLRTGDIGRMDSDGNLYFLGRKKDVIVTREGHNVFPEDVEGVLRELDQVYECAVVGAESEHGTEVHAAIILQDSKARPEDVIQAANIKLEAHQRIRGWTLWPRSDFPRTPSTGKIKRKEVARAVSGKERPESRPDETSSVRSILASITGRNAEELSGTDRLEQDLGLSSLDRVELLSLLEEKLDLDVDEDIIAAVQTVAELEQAVSEDAVDKGQLAASASAGRAPAGQPQDAARRKKRQTRTRLSVPTWNRFTLFRWLRVIFQATLFMGVAKVFLRLKVAGLSNLQEIQPPVIFAPNHASHMDTPALLAALPLGWRTRVAPAMRQEFFAPLVQPKQYNLLRRMLSRTGFMLLALFLNAYPLPQQTGGVRQALRFSGELVERGDCPLVFPEGERTPDGNLQSFQPGVGFMSKELDVPIVPVRLDGLFELFSIHHRFPRPGRASVTFGTPIFPSQELDAAGLTAKVRSRIEEMGSK
ncbi:MAG: AMP-binding protein [Desulfovermiculus sp.]